MVGATCSRVTFFMNLFRKLGFIRYDGTLQVHSALLNVVLHRWVRLHETAPCIARVDRTRWPPFHGRQVSSVGARLPGFAYVRTPGKWLLLASSDFLSIFHSHGRRGRLKPLALDICYTNKRRGEGIVFSLNPQQSWAEHSEGNRPILGRSAALCWFERLAALQATCLAA